MEPSSSPPRDLTPVPFSFFISALLIMGSFAVLMPAKVALQADPGFSFGTLIADTSNLIVGIVYLQGVANRDPVFLQLPRVTLFHLLLLNSVYWIFGGVPYVVWVVIGVIMVIGFALGVAVCVIQDDTISEIAATLPLDDIYFWRVCYISFAVFHGAIDPLFSLKGNVLSLFLVSLRSVVRYGLILLAWNFPAAENSTA